MYTIKINEDERRVLIDQIRARISYFDEEMQDSKDKDRILEIVKYTEPLRSVLNEVLNAKKQ